MKLHGSKSHEMRHLSDAALLGAPDISCYGRQSASNNPTQPAAAQGTIKVFAQGDSSRLLDFIGTCRREFGDYGMKLQLVRSERSYDYSLVVAQKSSVSGAAAAVVALEDKGLLVAAVVGSGRWSSKGTFNASAKELAKKLAALRNH